MKKIYYEKVGRKYVPVSEYDNDLLSSLPKGTHLIMVYPGGSSTKYTVDPAYAPMIAAAKVAEDVITKAISDASEIRRNERKDKPLTVEQQKAWQHLVDVFGEDARMLRYNSSHDIAQAGLKAMMEEAQKLLTVPAVKKAYEQFLLLCELNKDNK